MATMRSRNGSIRGSAGIVTAAEVNIAPTAPPSSRLTLWDSDSGAMAAIVVAVFAVIMLYIVL